MVAALPGEARALARAAVPPGGSHPLAGRGVLLLGGVGPLRAGLAARALVRRGVGGLVSWGVAAGLCPAVGPGAVVIPETVIGPDGCEYRCDRRWRSQLLLRLAGVVRVHRGPLAGAAGELRGTEPKRALHRATGAVAADMESAAVARVACGSSVPFLAVRAVVDPAGFAVPACALRGVDGLGQRRLLRLLGALVEHPREAAGLVRLAVSYGRALGALRTVGRAAGPGMGLLPPSAAGAGQASGERVEGRGRAVSAAAKRLPCEGGVAEPGSARLRRRKAAGGTGSRGDRQR
ncbi:MAG: hypothetical protein Kow0092_38540 [Deferrisomatales bacterium]